MLPRNSHRLLRSRLFREFSSTVKYTWYSTLTDLVKYFFITNPRALYIIIAVKAKNSLACCYYFAWGDTTPLTNILAQSEDIQTSLCSSVRRNVCRDFLLLLFVTLYPVAVVARCPGTRFSIYSNWVQIPVLASMNLLIYNKQIYVLIYCVRNVEGKHPEEIYIFNKRI